MSNKSETDLDISFDDDQSMLSYLRDITPTIVTAGPHHHAT